MKIKQEITKYADSLVGLEEKAGNSGFKEAWFERQMRRRGWKMYQSWCAYVAEDIWKTPYEKIGAVDVVEELDSLFSASAAQTWNNFIKAGYPHGGFPKVGSLVIWRKYKNDEPTWMGHIGVVPEVDINMFKAVEGNTNKGHSRNGFIVWKHTYTDWDKMYNVTDGLRLLGFVHLKDYILNEGDKKLKAYEF